MNLSKSNKSKMLFQYFCFSAEDLEKKLREAELREELLIRRITEKDKQMNKMR